MGTLIDEPTSTPELDRTTKDDHSDTGGGLTRLTINMTPASMRALNAIARTTGSSKTDTVNRAVQALQLLQDLMERGDGSILVRLPNGDFERIHIVF